MPLRTPFVALRFVVCLAATLIGVAAALVVVPVVEVLRECAEEWALAFRRAYALARP
jgi:hypothetical protein